MRRWSEPLDREEFLGIPDLAKELRRKETRLEVLRTRAEGDGALQLRERVQTSPSNAASAIADVMADLSIEVDGLREELHRLRAKAAKLFDEHLDGEELEVMRLHYIRDLTWLEIAELLHYEKRTVYRRQESAIEKMFGIGTE